ncbi:MAG TPA: Maf family nucleotide pyrophosphatase [Puia sp.]|nr:Maf family nucleotide pyrophosphatase [Puia sp.]
MDRIILASQSPRRQQLMEWARIDFEIMVSEADETFPESLPVGQVPIYIARNKADAVANKLDAEPIIVAADTIVVLQGKVLGKPKDRMDAISILSQLSGKEHQVITGVVIRQGKKEVSFADTTRVWFHELTLEQIEFYVDHYSPYDKAGAYAIQEWIGVVGIRSIEGDFYNVMGLPASRVIGVLGAWGSESE